MILVIDDDRLMRQAYVRTLSDLDQIIVCSGGEAISLIRENEGFNLILMEADYESVEGIKLFDTIATEIPDIPIILITKNESRIQNESFSEWGITHFFIKPVDLHVLSTTVKHLMTNDGDIHA